MVQLELKGAQSSAERVDEYMYSLIIQQIFNPCSPSSPLNVGGWAVPGFQNPTCFFMYGRCLRIYCFSYGKAAMIRIAIATGPGRIIAGSHG
jgi:hypothetical protein